MIKELKQNRINNIIENYLSNMIYENDGFKPQGVSFYYHKEYNIFYSLFVNNNDKRITIITNLQIETYITYKNCPIYVYINNKFGTIDYDVIFLEHFKYKQEFW